MILATDGHELTDATGAGRRPFRPLHGFSRKSTGMVVCAGVLALCWPARAGNSAPVQAAGGAAANQPISLESTDWMLIEMDDVKPVARVDDTLALGPPAGGLVAAAPPKTGEMQTVVSMTDFDDVGPVQANAPVSLRAAVPMPAPAPAPAPARMTAASVVATPVKPSIPSLDYEPLFPINESCTPDAAIAFADYLVAQAPQSPTLSLTNTTPDPSPELPAPVVGAMVVPAEELVSAIHQGGTKSTLINIYKGESVAIDLKCKIDRAETADPRVATVDPDRFDRLIVTGVGFGATQMRIYCGGKQANFSINVEMNLTSLRTLIQSISPSSQVAVRSVNGTVVLTGSVPDVATSERIGELATLFEGGKVQNQLNVAGVQQTLLRVVVAEVNKTAIRSLGVNWAIGASNWSRDFFFANNINQINPTVFSSNGLPNIVAPNPAGQMLYSVAPTANGLNTNVTFGFPKAEFQVFVNALRENQLFRVLAEPNLTCISGQTASFLAGGEVPIPVTQGGATAGAIVIEYKEFGVRLHFTPTVVGRQVMRLHVLSEFSDAIPGPAVIGGLPTFSFTTRRVESTVECGNGQTFAIAGLLSERVQAISSKLPALGDIPVLGALFQSVNYQKTNTELVILVTPELVQPLDPQMVGPPPGALMTDPNDFELMIMGQLEGTPNPPPEPEAIPRHEQPVKTFPLAISGAQSRAAMHGTWGVSDLDAE